MALKEPAGGNAERRSPLSEPLPEPKPAPATKPEPPPEPDFSPSWPNNPASWSFDLPDPATSGWGSGEGSGSGSEMRVRYPEGGSGRKEDVNGRLVAGAWA